MTTIILNKIKISNNRPFVLIAGPCVIESKKHAFLMAESIKKITDSLNIPFIFKASYDKANRTSVDSFRGPGLKEGLIVLEEIKNSLHVPVLSDVHSESEIEKAARVLDVIQIPAFLCRQTDLLVKAGQTGKIINVKKGQFLAPGDITHAVKKIASSGNKNIMLTERGVSFGYNNLVTDFRSIEIMKKLGYPIIFDATHSVQQPGGLGHASGGSSEFIPLLSRCAIVSGVAALFMEVHNNPKKALSDGPNMIALDKLKNLLIELKAIDQLVKKIK